MKTLLLGGGGREHALALALAPSCDLYAAPGNPGIAQVATLVDLDPLAGEEVARWSVAHGIELVVIGPEAPLVAGVADAVRAAGIAVFGPDRAAAALEGSKAFAKDVMAAAGVATAAARVCRRVDEVASALDEFGAPYVVKDDGLAAGKGVIVTDDREAALAHARACLGKDGGQVLVEEYLDGPEASVFCVCDGTRVLALSPAQDFKRACDGQRGPNTGGMGAYTPLPWAPDDLAQRVIDEVAQPTITEMARRGTPFVGLLYCGLALTSRGLRVVEFNARFGDPETQVVAPIEGPRLASLLYLAATGRLDEAPARVETPGAAVTVVIANEGYPGPLVEAGRPISGLAEAAAVPGVHLIHAGTALNDGHLVAQGGRVLNVVATAASLREARERAYAAVDAIHLEGAHVRRDIAAAACEQ